MCIKSYTITFLFWLEQWYNIPYQCIFYLEISMKIWNLELLFSCVSEDDEG